MRTVNIHPFPARMAPELALDKTRQLAPNSIVLDPMVGSGTVLQAAAQNGLRCIGFDVDPLAVLMSRVSTSKFDAKRFDKLVRRLIAQSDSIDLRQSSLPWFDAETEEFADYWFAPMQRRDLSRLALVLQTSPCFRDGSAEADAVKLALSRLIITKERGASLARDVSHSRPHRVADYNDFDVPAELARAAGRLSRKLQERERVGSSRVRLGDARLMPWVRNNSVDMVMTSPPYLNAIDYMRGHRLSLIWLGYSLAYLRNVRSNSIGAERGGNDSDLHSDVTQVTKALGKIDKLPSRYQNMIGRFSLDLVLLSRQVARVLKPRGHAVFVVGNSRLKDVFVYNSRGLEVAATLSGLKLLEEQTRRLPAGSRYLPIPKDRDSSLGRRMRTEVVLTFQKPKAH